MREFELCSFGVQPIAGDDVRGGSLPSVWVAIIAGGVAAFVANWRDVKAGFADGWNDS